MVRKQRARMRGVKEKDTEGEGRGQGLLPGLVRQSGIHSLNETYLRAAS